MKLKSLLVISFSLTLLLSGCGHISVPDLKVCAVNGELQNGLMCTTTLSKVDSDMDFDESLDFIQANEEHGGALIMSSKDWVKLKNTIESACKILGKRRCKKKLKSLPRIFRSIKKRLRL